MLRNEEATYEMQEGSTYFAGHPRVNLVFTILVVGSNISKVLEDSTAGSHSCRSSGVKSTAFQASRSTISSSAGISRMTLYTSPALVDLRWIETSFPSGLKMALAFPLLPEEEFSRAASGTRFHEED